MQISDTISRAYFPPRQSMGRGAKELAQAAAVDALGLDMSPRTFISLVGDALTFPDVRSEVVGSFKARIAAGHYPSHDDIAGLSRLMGGSMARDAE